MLSVRDKVHRKIKCFQALKKSIQKKWRKTTSQHLGICFPLEIPEASTTAGAGQPLTSCLWLRSSQTFQELPKKGSDFPSRGFGLPPSVIPADMNGGKEYSWGYQVQINTLILMSSNFGSNCLFHHTPMQRVLLASLWSPRAWREMKVLHGRLCQQ